MISVPKAFLVFAYSRARSALRGGNAQRLGSNADAASSQGLHRKTETKAIFPDPVFLGTLHVEHHRMGVAGADAHFIFLGSYHYTGPVFSTISVFIPFEPFRRIRLGHYKVYRGVSAIRDPVLGTVQQVVIALVLRRWCAERWHHCPPGLAEHEGPDIQFAVFTTLGQWREVFCFCARCQIPAGRNRPGCC